ncbi:MAG: YbhB/YbcL family Raf kinase inhibitor-like protein [Candidatus Marinimicrobia bacterium]|nr:YbhB/YbcL family Raf kinase inhibitor-like protein [Candidatus Neomarinimicrobiota bacterium]MCF7827665.1 YbhB/YbcL family Raf kinase inhibitor-like protein [Candidatus Neomarinimicrobiota bacterium]MCF7881280.1 YbhB/YbcL family Raf kinase inhibitor-like protein [Candidatus Neomarinimicrobiota bacterium]
MSIKIVSSAFEQEGMIPKKYTCDGADVSPPLEWSGVPDAAESIVLIADDPDAPGKTWVHWVLFNLPVEVTSLGEGVPKEATLKNGAIQGITDFGSNGYGGPCPPGGIHRYFFKVYALDNTLDLDSTARKADVINTMDGNVLAKGELMGKYERQ